MIDKKYNMIKYQLESRGIKNKKVLDVFYSINRENFVTEEMKPYAYEDSALPLFKGQTISQPYIVALMTELLDPKEEDEVLEIGTGSGYQSAILSKLVKKVYSVEIVKELVEFAKQNLNKENIKNVEVFYGDATSDLEIFKNKKFDKIIVTAATKEIPIIWVDLLKEGGRLVVPLGNMDLQTLTVFVKKNGDLKKLKEVINVIFVPLKRSGEN